jgi:hypothetical protein
LAARQSSGTSLNLSLTDDMSAHLTLHEKAAYFSSMELALKQIAAGHGDAKLIARTVLESICISRPDKDANFSGVKPGESSNNNNEPVADGSSAACHRPIKPKNTMKKMLSIVGVAVLLATVGCVPLSTIHKQVLTKQTIFGFQLAANPNTGITGIIPQVQFGLVRSEYISNPTSTNQVYAAPISSHVVANLGMLSQSADETQSFGK